MPIATLTDIKNILQITGSEKDSTITALLPVVQEFIVNQTNNDFSTELVYVSGTSLLFDAETKTITDEVSSDFITEGFKAGMDICVTNSLFNDGHYSIATVEANKLTLNESVIDEDSNQWIMISLVRFPKSLKLLAAQIISIVLNKALMNGISSESLGDWSTSYVATGDFPKSVFTQLANFTKLR